MGKEEKGPAGGSGGWVIKGGGDERAKGCVRISEGPRSKRGSFLV